MSNLAIRVEGLGKKYRIGERPASYQTLRDSLTNSFGRISSLFSSNRHRSKPEDFWALRNVSFDVKHGEVVGVIGRNGAGKSTLLKILSRITQPTEGRASVHGRVGSLLEVGTGFHPELTGRDNIYLNGAILGMRKAEIDCKFDEIVEFANVDKFLDTPVKRYSSGMLLRLGFSVAAHLEPTILVVDEVLAVGDADFQRKCLRKMHDVARAGRTVLLVSHNMAAIQHLCNRAIILQTGRLFADEDVINAVEHYLATVTALAAAPLAGRLDRRGNGSLRFESFQLLDAAGTSLLAAQSGQAVQFSLKYQSTSLSPLRKVHVAIGVHGRFDQHLFHLATNIATGDFDSLPPQGEIRCVVPNLPLQPGVYLFNLYSTVARDVADWVQAAGIFTVDPGDFFGSGRLPPPSQGPFLVTHCWTNIATTHNGAPDPLA